MVMSYCKLPSHSLPGDREGNCKYVRFADLWAEIQIEDLQVHSRSTGHSSMILVKSHLRYRLYWWKLCMVLQAGKFWATSLEDVLFPLAYFFMYIIAYIEYHSMLCN
jgi:hypothetical protein